MFGGVSLYGHPVVMRLITETSTCTEVTRSWSRISQIRPHQCVPSWWIWQMVDTDGGFTMVTDALNTNIDALRIKNLPRYAAVIAQFVTPDMLLIPFQRLKHRMPTHLGKSQRFCWWTCCVWSASVFGISDRGLGQKIHEVFFSRLRLYMFSQTNFATTLSPTLSWNNEQNTRTLGVHQRLGFPSGDAMAQVYTVLLSFFVLLWSSPSIYSFESFIDCEEVHLVLLRGHDSNATFVSKWNLCALRGK